MRIEASRRAAFERTGVSGGKPAPAPETSRALVPLTPPAAPQWTVASHRQAPFLAQLLAAKDRHPQTCERRRATPGEAMTAYRSVAALTAKS